MSAATAARARLAEDYRVWHGLQVATSDVDPVYPVLRALAARQRLTADERAWLCLLHVAYYDLGSALRVFSRTRTAGPPTPGELRYRTGTERRGHRVPARLDAHWRGLLEACDRHGGPDALLHAAGGDWRALQDHLVTIPGNGRWAAYKLGELAQKVCEVPVTIADAGHAHSTGPRKGLALLYDVPAGDDAATIARLDAWTTELASDLGERDIGQVETSLCDFHSLAKGGYYLGHDIDAMGEQVLRQPSDATQAVLDARAAALPASYLAEATGRPIAVDKQRRSVYARTGRIVAR